MNSYSISRFLRIVFAGFTVAFTAATAAQAGALPEPTSDPILTIAGNIEHTNDEGTARFDLQMLEAMEQITVETSTPWHDAVVQFEGISLAELMDLVGAKGESVLAVALNDYTIEIPMEDFARHGVILATKKDGEYMPVRDKGPLFIIYPYDSDPELQSQTYYGRSAWQLARLVVQ